MADWTLETCCETEEVWYCSMFGLYLVINALLWSHPSQILKPMKLIAVFFHEFSHATMCWLTGGRVEGIEVYNNEGGVTKYRGGRRLCVIPAGYIGGAVFGGIFVAFSGDRIAATIACSFFIACLLTALFYSPNKTMAYLNLGFALATLAFILFDWFVATPFIQFVCLYYGVTIGSFSIYDTIEDTVTRTAEGSDAVACSELIPICHPRCIGVQFALAGFAFLVLGGYFGLVWMIADNAAATEQQV